VKPNRQPAEHQLAPPVGIVAIVDEIDAGCALDDRPAAILVQHPFAPDGCPVPFTPSDREAFRFVAPSLAYASDLDRSALINTNSVFGRNEFSFRRYAGDGWPITSGGPGRQCQEDRHATESLRKTAACSRGSVVPARREVVTAELAMVPEVRAIALFGSVATANAKFQPFRHHRIEVLHE
jgi:hypothetical protein